MACAQRSRLSHRTGNPTGRLNGAIRPNDPATPAARPGLPGPANAATKPAPGQQRANQSYTSVAKNRYTVRPINPRSFAHPQNEGCSVAYELG